MERMKHTGDYELDEINMLEQECADLEEDNKRLEEENRKLKEDVEFFRQCYLDLKKLCEDGGFLLPNEEIAKMFNLDEIK